MEIRACRLQIIKKASEGVHEIPTSTSILIFFVFTKTIRGIELWLREKAFQALRVLSTRI